MKIVFIIILKVVAKCIADIAANIEWMMKGISDFCYDFYFDLEKKEITNCVIFNFGSCYRFYLEIR